MSLRYLPEHVENALLAEAATIELLSRDCPLAPFALSLSKGSQGFDPSSSSGQDKLSPNGKSLMDNLG